MAKYNVTVNGETFSINADRCDIQDGMLVFFGTTETGTYGVIRALKRDAWEEMALAT